MDIDDDLNTKTTDSNTQTPISATLESYRNDDLDDEEDEDTASTYQREHLQRKMNSLFQTLEPLINALDQHVIAVRSSQEMLNQELNILLKLLHQIRIQESLSVPGSPTSSASHGAGTSSTLSAVVPTPKGRISNDISIDVEDKSRRLLGLKRRLTLVHSILSTVNSRVKKLLLAHNSRISINN